MASTLSTRVTERMDVLGLNNAALARASEVKPPTSYNWAHGKTKSIKGEPLLRAAKALGVKPEWLATGKGPMSDDPAAPKTEKETTNALKAALRDWRMHASPRSVQVIDRLTLLAEKESLREEDWTLIDQLAKRLKQAS